MNPLLRAKTVSLLRAAIAVAFCALVILPRVESDEGPKYTVLAMEYFGAIDRPIYPVVISDSRDGAEWYRDVLREKNEWDKGHLIYLPVVSSPLVVRLIAIVETKTDGAQEELNRQKPYNRVSMTIVTPQGRKTFFFPVEPAMPLLHQLESLCKDYTPLRLHLLGFQEQVIPWGDMSAPRPEPLAAGEKEPLVEVRGPTVVAFLGPVKQDELEKNPDTNEALVDFQLCANHVHNRLMEAGIEFHILYGHSFRLRVGQRLTTFRSAKGVGYYLVEPSKKPRIDYGVMTDLDLLKVAKKYFGISAQ